MRLDTHLHVWWPGDGAGVLIRRRVPGLEGDHSLESVEPALRAADVAGVILVSAAQEEADSDRLLAVAATRPGLVRGVIGWLDLERPDIAERIAHYRGRPAMLGVRLALSVHPDPGWIARPAVHDGLAALRDAGAVAEILALPSQLAGVARVLARLPGLAAIIDHAGMPDFAAPPTAEWREAIARLSRLPDTLCKITSFWNPGDPPVEDRRALAILGPVLEAFGPARIIAGANWPCTKLAGPYIQSWTLIDRLLAASGLGAAEQAAILYHNAARLCRTHAS